MYTYMHMHANTYTHTHTYTHMHTHMQTHYSWFLNFYLLKNRGAIIFSFLKVLNFIHSVYVYAYVYQGACICGDQRTTWGSQFFPTIVCLLSIKPQAGLVSSIFVTEPSGQTWLLLLWCHSQSTANKCKKKSPRGDLVVLYLVICLLLWQDLISFLGASGSTR